MLEHGKCPTQCHLMCTEFIHMYSCTCMDYTINHTRCKHIHQDTDATHFQNLHEVLKIKYTHYEIKFTERCSSRILKHAVRV